MNVSIAYLIKSTLYLSGIQIKGFLFYKFKFFFEFWKNLYIRIWEHLIQLSNHQIKSKIYIKYISHPCWYKY